MLPTSAKLAFFSFALVAVGIGAGCAAAPTDDDAVAESTSSSLETKDHSKITGRSCRDAKLPEAFCVRLEQEAFDVDHNEWTDLSAHSQTELGQSTCDAAAAAQKRLHDLGAEVRAILKNDIDGSPDPSVAPAAGSNGNNLAHALGRAMHTIQDNCAHSGMSNQQHAWLSDMDICVAPDMNPDTKPAALQCAREESAAIMASFKEALLAANMDPDSLSTTTAITESNPSRTQACNFIREWKKWDGVDGRWDNDKTRAAFRETLTTAFTAEKATKDLCADGESLTSPDHEPDMKVTNPWCPGLSIFCIGK